jgi:hypothetical protein
VLTTMAKEGGRWEDRETVGVENPCLTCLERLECVLGDLVWSLLASVSPGRQGGASFTFFFLGLLGGGDKRERKKKAVCGLQANQGWER